MSKFKMQSMLIVSTAWPTEAALGYVEDFTIWGALFKKKNAGLGTQTG